MNKKNLILGGILVVLVVFTWTWNGPAKNWRAEKNEEGNFLSSVLAEKVSLIKIDKAGTVNTLELVDGRWKVGGTKDYVKKEVMDEVIFALDKVAKGKMELASDNKEKKSEFGVDNGIKVSIKQDGKDFDFVVGNATANFDGSYVSLADNDKTWKLGVDLSSVFSRGDWRDGQILSFMKERADKIRFQYPKRQFTMEKKENKWSGTLPRKFTVTEDKLNAVLEVMENLSASKIPDQDFKAFGAPEKNGIIIQITGEQLDETLMIGNCTKDNMCYVKRGSSDNIYMITKEQRDKLDKQSKDFK